MVVSLVIEQNVDGSGMLNGDIFWNLLVDGFVQEL